MAALTRDLFTLSPGEVDDMWIMRGSGEVSDSTDEHSDLQGSDEDSSDEQRGMSVLVHCLKQCCYII